MFKKFAKFWVKQNHFEYLLAYPVYIVYSRPSYQDLLNETYLIIIAELFSHHWILCPSHIIILHFVFLYYLFPAWGRAWGLNCRTSAQRCSITFFVHFLGLVPTSASTPLEEVGESVWSSAPFSMQGWKPWKVRISFVNNIAFSECSVWFISLFYLLWREELSFQLMSIFLKLNLTDFKKYHKIVLIINWIFQFLKTSLFINFPHISSWIWQNFKNFKKFY